VETTKEALYATGFQLSYYCFTWVKVRKIELAPSPIQDTADSETARFEITEE
jgi:hypothetical protein